METSTTDSVKNAGAAKPMSLSETLRIHNAKHPESTLADITTRVEIACGRRLISRLYQRFPHSKSKIDTFAGCLDADFPDGYQLLCICAGFLLARRTVRDLGWENPKQGWEDVKQVMQTGKGQPDAVYLATRATRAARLLNRLLVSGCLKRGEA